ncbi:MAG: hypothetical protein JO053_15780 [Acidobacteria bacterium]|nr:hypothetical protein [Acidobacteriota bacterium]
MKFKALFHFAVLAAFLSLGITANAQNPYRVSDSEVQKLINRLDHDTDNFKGEMGHALDRSHFNGTKREDKIKDFISDFETATDKLHDHFSKHSSAAGDVQDVLLKARAVNRFMKAHDMGTKANTFWSIVRGELDQLAGYYNVTIWDWTIEDPWPVEP